MNYKKIKTRITDFCYRVWVRYTLDRDSMDGEMWMRLVRSHPKLTDICEWDKLSGHDWQILLCVRPGFVEYCDWGKLDSWNLSCLMREQPQLLSTCGFLKRAELHKGDLFWALLGSPEIAEHYSNWELFGDIYWQRLLSHRPEIIKYLDEKGQILAVNAYSGTLRHVANPSDKLIRLHRMKHEL